jgi:hypothetical protein
LTTTGDMASAPTPASGLLVIRNVQACWSFATLADEMTESGACRVLARSAFGYGHEPDGGVAPGFVVVAGFVLVAGGLLLLHAAASRATSAARRQKLLRVRLMRFGADIALAPSYADQEN